jgi:hypothetical protein
MTYQDIKTNIVKDLVEDFRRDYEDNMHVLVMASRDGLTKISPASVAKGFAEHLANMTWDELRDEYPYEFTNYEGKDGKKLLSFKKVVTILEKRGIDVDRIIYNLFTVDSHDGDKAEMTSEEIIDYYLEVL